MHLLYVVFAGPAGLFESGLYEQWITPYLIVRTVNVYVFLVQQSWIDTLPYINIFISSSENN